MHSVDTAQHLIKIEDSILVETVYFTKFIFVNKNKIKNIEIK